MEGHARVEDWRGFAVDLLACSEQGDGRSVATIPLPGELVLGRNKGISVDLKA